MSAGEACADASVDDARGRIPHGRVDPGSRPAEAAVRRVATTRPARRVSSTSGALAGGGDGGPVPVLARRAPAGRPRRRTSVVSSSPLPKHSTSIACPCGIPVARDRMRPEGLLRVGVVVRADREMRHRLVRPPAAAKVPRILLEACERQEPGAGAVDRPAARLAEVVDARPQELARDVVVSLDLQPVGVAVRVLAADERLVGEPRGDRRRTGAPCSCSRRGRGRRGAPSGWTAPAAPPPASRAGSGPSP